MNTKQAFDYWNNIEQEYLKTIKYIPKRPFRTPRELQVWIWKEIFQETRPFNVDDFICSLQQVKKLWELPNRDTFLTEEEQSDNKALTHFFGEEANENSETPRKDVSSADLKEFEEWKERVGNFIETEKVLQEKERQLKSKEDQLLEKEGFLASKEENVRSREADVLLCDLQFEEKLKKLEKVEEMLVNRKNELKEIQKTIAEQQKSLEERLKNVKTNELVVEGKKKKLAMDEKVLKIRMEEAEKVIKSPETLTRVHSMDLCNLNTLNSPRSRSQRNLTPTLTSPRCTVVMSRERKQSLEQKDGGEQEDIVSKQVRNLLKENFSQMQEINVLREGLEESKLKVMRLEELVKTQNVFGDAKQKKTLDEQEIDDFTEVLTRLISSKSKETREALSLSIYDVVKVHIPKNQNASLRKSLNSKKKFRYSTRHKSADISISPLDIRVESSDLTLSINQFSNDEFNYFQRLVEFNEMYVKALLETTKYRKLGEQISSVLEPLITLSRNIVNGLEEAIMNEKSVQIGSVIKKYLDTFSIYTAYFGAYQSIAKSFPDIQENLDLNKHVVLCVASYVQAQRNASLSNGTTQTFTPPLPESPSAYLHFPISRLEEYVNFFGSLLKQSAPIDPDYELISECFETLGVIYKSSLSLLETATGNDELSTVQKVLRKSTGGLIQKRRKLIHFGLLIPIGDEFAKKGPRLCFLMNDLFLMTTIKKFNGNTVDQGFVMRKFSSRSEWSIEELQNSVLNEELRVELTPPITTLIVSDEEVHNAFLIVQYDLKLHFIAPSEESRDKWLSVIESL